MEFRWFSILTQDEYDSQLPQFVHRSESRRDVYFVVPDVSLGLKIRNIDRMPTLERKERNSRSEQGVEHWQKNLRRRLRDGGDDEDAAVVFRSLEILRGLVPEYRQIFQKEKKVICGSVAKLRRGGSRNVSEQVLLKVRYFIADAVESTLNFERDIGTVYAFTASVEGYRFVPDDVLEMTEGSSPMGYPEWLFVTYQALKPKPEAGEENL